MMREREYSISGRYPWNSSDAMTYVSTLPMDDGEKELNKCLRCRKKECNNCLCKDPTSKMIDKCEKLIDKNMTSRQICAKLHIARSTFFLYKKACVSI